MTIRLKRVPEQVAVIFGASSGIGREVALRMAKLGAKLVVAARSEEGLDSLLGEIEGSGGHAVAVTAEASDFGQVKAVADRAVSEYGRLDTWVHCAAVAVYATFEQTTPDEFRRIIDVNLNGAAYGAMAALPHLKREGGALIVISSAEARRALPYHSAYSASKHGIKGFLEALRMELEREGAPVSVTNIMPASINTPFFNKSRTKLGVKPKPMPPIYDPGIVADVILYAAEHPARDMVAGGAGRAFKLGEAISQSAMDKFLGATAFDGQQTDEPKSANAPDNLYEHMPGYNRTRGDFTDEARTRSAYTWWETHPQAQWAFAGSAAIGAFAYLMLRRRKSETQVPSEDQSD